MSLELSKRNGQLSRCYTDLSRISWILPGSPHALVRDNCPDCISRSGMIHPPSTTPEDARSPEFSRYLWSFFPLPNIPVPEGLGWRGGDGEMGAVRKVVRTVLLAFFRLVGFKALSKEEPQSWLPPLIPPPQLPNTHREIEN